MHVCTHKYVSIYSRGMSPMSSSPTSCEYLHASPFLQLPRARKMHGILDVSISPPIAFSSAPSLVHFFDLPLPSTPAAALLRKHHLLRDVMRHHHHLRSSGTSSSSSASPSSTTSTSTAIRRKSITISTTTTVSSSRFTACSTSAVWVRDFLQ